MVYFRYLLNVIGLSAVFVVCVGLRCVLATWFKPRWPVRPRPRPGRYTVRVFRFRVASGCVCCVGGDWLARIAAGCDRDCQRTRGFPAEHLAASAESLFGGLIFFVRHRSEEHTSE